MRRRGFLFATLSAFCIAAPVMADVLEGVTSRFVRQTTIWWT